MKTANTKFNDLIVVGYSAGYGGDLFSALLESDSYIFESNKRNTSNKHHFHTDLSRFKSLDSLLYECGKRIELGVTKYNTSAYVYCKKEIDLIYDEDPINVVDNLTFLCRSAYYSSRPRVANFHYYETLRTNIFGFFNFNMIFPGSTKIRLVADPYYHDLFTALCYFKIDMSSHPPDRLKRLVGSIESFLNRYFPTNRKEFLCSPLEDFVDIDVGRLFFEGGNYIKSTEEQLSEVIGKPIKLDVNYINNVYIPKNNSILEHMIGTQYLNNTESENTQRVFDYINSDLMKALNEQH